MQKRGATWKVRKRQSSNLLEHLCVLRGQRLEKLEPEYSEHLHDPYLLPDMEKACTILTKVIQEKRHITIFGDYDADGTPAAALLSIVFDKLGVSHEVVLPTRETGYGLRSEDVEIAAKKSQLLITVDTGVTSVDEIALAKKQGLSVIVLDHHLPKETLPPADALIDPFLESSTYPFRNLCGCALAFKLTEALAKYFPEELPEPFRKWLLDLVAISTVSDMMVLRDENRVLVHYGLMVLRKNRRVGLRALLECAGVKAENIDAGTIGFAIGPRLNASGRIGDNRPTYELLKATDSKTARTIAEEIEKNNQERQKLVEKTLEEAQKVLFTQNEETDKLFVVVGDSWQPGVLGLVAGKISATYRRPVIVLTKKDGQYVGSGRSPETYPLINALEDQKKVLDRYGGHATAAGLALTPKNLEKIKKGLKKHAATYISEKDLQVTRTADAILDHDEVNLAAARSVEKLAPFGFGNPQPLFIVQDVQVSEPKIIGKNGTHVKLRGSIEDQIFDIVGFGLAATHIDHDHSLRMDCMGYLEENVWNGMRKLQLRVVDYRPHGEEIEVLS